MLNINNSISAISHVHSLTQTFLIQRLNELGLPEFVSSHGNILFQLSVNKTMKMGELAEKINRDKSTTTVLVRKLEENGFVTSVNDSLDKRNKIICLTDKGKKYNEVTTSISKELISTFYKGFDETEKEKLVEFLNRIQTNFTSLLENDKK